MLNRKYDKILHLVGAQKTNSPWGFENRLIPVFETIGFKVISTDFRQEKDRLPELLLKKADIILICKGEGIPSQLIRSAPCVTALWYAEQIGTPDHYDDLAQFRRNELSFNVGSFDYVFSHDQGNLDVYKGLGAKRVAWLSCAAVDPDVNCKINASKQHDVVFIGSKTPRRQRILFELERHGITVYSPNIWDPIKLNQIFNESRIVLNIHLSDLLNTETRIAEVMGSGSFLLSEKISSPDFLTEGKHYVSWSPGNTDELVEKIVYYLTHEKERERIAHEGYCYIHEHHTYDKRIETFLDSIDFDLNQRIWPSYELGFLFDSNGQPTLRQDSFYRAISETLSKTEKPKKPEEMIEPPNKEKSSPQNSPSHLAKKNIHSDSKRGNLRIFAAFSNVNWEDNNLQPALEHFGEVIRFQWNFYDQYKPSWHFSDKMQMNHRMLEALRSAHKEKSIDLFFGYVSGRTVFPGVIRSIGEMGISTLCLSLDDKAKFYGDLESTGYTGMVDIANAFTLCWTSTEDAINKYESVGAKALYLPSGANPDVFRPYELPRDIDVSFIGQKYGQRISIIEEIRKRGIDIKTFGKGWESGEILQEEMIKLYSRSKITLGFAEVAGSNDLLCLKGRDFEVPMSGGFYLTQYHPELEKWFEIGKEIECYWDIDDMVEKIRYYLAHPEDANRIREAGRQKSIKDHTWVGRFKCAFETMGMHPVSHSKKQEDYKEPEFQYTEDWYDKVYHKGRFDLSMGFDEIERTRYLAYRNRCYSVLDSIYEIILDFKGNKEKLNWLEVCCQLGMTAKWVADKFPFVSMHMFDFSESVVQWLTTNFPYDANIWKGRIENIQNNESEFERYFDVVTCIDVTEHLPEEVYFKAIDEIHKVLKPGGLLLLMQGVCKENPEHINIREESQFVQEFIERGFRYLRTFPYRHHLLERLSTSKFDKTSVESQTTGLICHKNEDQMVSNLLKQGEELYYDNNLERAKDVFKEILSIDPNHVKALNNLGVLAFRQGDLGLAVTMFEQAYSIRQDYIESIENMGKCFETEGDFKKAIKWFKKALSLNNKSVEMLNNIGNCYVKVEEYSKASEMFSKSISLDDSQEAIVDLLKCLKEGEQLINGERKYGR